MGPEELACSQESRPRAVPAALVDLGLLALSALLFALSFPSFLSNQGWFPLGFVCLAPLFVVVRRASWPAIPFYGFFFGYASYALFNYWLGKFHPLTLVVVPPIYAVYFLVTLPALKLADVLAPRHPYLLQAGLWVCYEYFLKSSGFLAYSYGNLGYTQYAFLPFIQIADTVGVWGISLLVVFPSALAGRAFADGLAALREQWKRYAIPAAGFAAAFAGVVDLRPAGLRGYGRGPPVEGGPRAAGRRSLERRLLRLPDLPGCSGAPERQGVGRDTPRS